MIEPEKLDLRSHDVAEEKRQELLSLFPEIRTEGGKLDFERLKLALGEAVDVGKERYGMTWPGKADCFGTIQAPSLGTLRPCPEESVNFDTTENLIIEGDSLEVLKLLQKSYLGKVKMIYIDPPYNTGNDFIYPDNYTESLQTYLEYTGQVDAEGRCFDFLGYTYGPERSRKDGHWYLSAKPSKKSVKRVKEKVRKVLRPGNHEPWPEVASQLNRILRGWANYFSHGTRLMGYRAVDRYVASSVRDFLRRRHKVQHQRGTVRFADERIFGPLGVQQLRKLLRGAPV